MGTFDCEVDAPELFAILKKQRMQGADLSTTMQVVGEQLLAAVSDQFDSEGGGKWAPLADSTIARRRGGGDHKILQDTGALAGSQAVHSGADFAEVSTDKFYAVFHVSEAPRHIIPLRNFYDLPEDVYTVAVATILAAVTK